MRIEVKSDKELTPAERRCLEESFGPLLAEDTGNAESTDEFNWGEVEWADIDWHVFFWEGEEMVSHVEIIERTGMVGGQPVLLGGIGGVATRLPWRGRGCATAAMQKAAEFMRSELQVDFGLLICDQQREPFYRRLGWQRVEGPMVFDQISGKITFSDVIMVLACRQSVWPAGGIDLCGLPW